MPEAGRLARRDVRPEDTPDSGGTVLDYTTPEYHLGHVAFDGYRRHTNGLTHDGRSIPEWRDLGEAVQSAWIAAAAAVVEAQATVKERPDA